MLLPWILKVQKSLAHILQSQNFSSSLFFLSHTSSSQLHLRYNIGDNWYSRRLPTEFSAGRCHIQNWGIIDSLPGWWYSKRWADPLNIYAKEWVLWCSCKWFEWMLWVYKMTHKLFIMWLSLVLFMFTKILARITQQWKSSFKLAGEIERQQIETAILSIWCWRTARFIYVFVLERGTRLLLKRGLSSGIQ